MISELFAMYPFGAIHTVDITDSKVTNQPPGVPLNLRYSAVYTCPVPLQVRYSYIQDESNISGIFL